MKNATDLRVGNMLRIEGRFCRVTHQELKGTGKFGKTVHLKLKSLEDGHTLEKSFRAEEKVEDVDAHRVKMQYLYKDGTQYMFMSMENYEQFAIPEKSVGAQSVFLKENMEIDVEFAEGQPLAIDFPKIAELQVVSTPAPQKGGNDSTFKEAELENGLKVLVPQFVKQGESVRINTEDFSYLDRVTTKSLKTELSKPEE